MNIVILGGGLAGLSAADKLIHKHKVTILEKEKHLGGLAASFDYRQWKIPRHYHHVFNHDYVTQSFLKRFGLFKNMVWKKIKMCICVNKKTYRFIDPIGLLKFDYLSYVGRIRYGLFGFWVLFIMNPSKIDDRLDARKWLYAKVGKEVTDKVFYHLQARNKFGIPLQRISAKQFAHRLKAKEAIGNFGYPRKGIFTMVAKLESDLKKRGCAIFKYCSVESIDVKKRLVKIRNAGEIKYDALINTIPIPEFLRIAKGLPKDYINRISRIKYCPAVTVVFGTDDLLADYYWINLLNERVHMIMQHSWLYDGYDKKVSWVLRYGGSQEDLGLSDAKIRKDYLDVVKKYFPGVNVRWCKVFREQYASPIYDKDYHKNNPGYKSPVKGLYNAGIAVTYPKIRNMNTALESGQRVAEMIEE